MICPFLFAMQVVRFRLQRFDATTNQLYFGETFVFCGFLTMCCRWLHGFQRRIFEQTKGILRKLKRSMEKEKRGSPSRYHASTVSNLSSLFAPANAPSPSTSSAPALSTPDLHEEKKADPKKGLGRKVLADDCLTGSKDLFGDHWLIATEGAQQGRRKNMEDEMLKKIDLNAECNLDPAKHGNLALFAVFDGGSRCCCAFLCFLKKEKKVMLEENVQSKKRETGGGGGNTFFLTRL
jgi:hypothetical protein